MPDRWASRCSTVTSSAIRGRSSPSTERAVVVSRSVPSSTRLITTSAVKAFVPLASANTVSTLFSMPWARSARPYAFVSSMRPERPTLTTPENLVRSATASTAPSRDRMSSERINGTWAGPSSGSDVSEQQVQRPRHVRKIERADEEGRVPSLPAAPGAHEAPELLLRGLPLLRRLTLERAERPELALGVDHVLHGVGADGTDQLVLEVRDADVEAQRFHLVTRKVGAESG